MTPSSPRWTGARITPRLHGICACAVRRRRHLRYAFRMDAAVGAPPAPQLRNRAEIPARFKWNLAHIFPEWTTWEEAFRALEEKIGAYAALQGTLAKGPGHILTAMKLSDDI